MTQNQSIKSQQLKELLKFELCRRQFWVFCLHYDEQFFISRPFLKEIADAFQEIEERTITSLSVSLPPRAGKSYITSLFCAWTTGRNPDQSVMRNTCTATLFLKFSYDVRTIVKSDKFKQIFTDVVLSDDKSNLQGWNTNKSKQVAYFGAGVGGTIIGFGASNVAITDDLYRGIEDALSDTINDRINSWKESTHDSRFERGCARIDIGTRWSLNDVIGRNIESHSYQKTIMVKALDEKDQSFCEAVMSTDEYLDKRKKTANEIWCAEYQQEPVDIAGRTFTDIKTIGKDEFDAIKDQIEGCIGYVDVADAGIDYTALAICAIIKNELYIVDYVFSRENTDVTIPLVAQKLNEWNVNYCRVESNNVGAMFGRSLQKETKSRILLVHNSVNKMTRIMMQSAFIQNRFIFVKTGDQNQELFIQNLLSFTKEGRNKNDDAPDCCAGLSIFVQSMFKNLH
jgi:predicted phage terminase large subunit-like protein